MIKSPEIFRAFSYFIYKSLKLCYNYLMEILNKLIKLITPKPRVIVPESGMVAYEDGFRLAQNPFREHTPDHSIWRDDWLFSAGRFR